MITGSPAISSGTGTLHGTGTLPAGLPDGYALSLLMFYENGAMPLSPTGARSCGREFEYTITQVDTGSGGLEYNLYALTSHGVMPDYEGTSTNQFTIAAGQDVEFDPTF